MELKRDKIINIWTKTKKAIKRIGVKNGILEDGC